MRRLKVAGSDNHPPETDDDKPQPEPNLFLVEVYGMTASLGDFSLGPVTTAYTLWLAGLPNVRLYHVFFLFERGARKGGARIASVVAATQRDLLSG